MEQSKLVVRAVHGRHRSRWAVVVAVSCVLGACSSDDGDAGTTTPAVTAAPDPSSVPESATTEVTTPGATDPAGMPTTDAPGDGTTPSGGSLEAPSGDAFYTPPDPIPGAENGDLIWARPLDQIPAGTAGWQVLYRSESVSGDPIAVSGVVISPLSPSATDGPRPVLSWAHGTSGIGDECAPSKGYDDGSATELMLLPIVNSLGWTFVATDYEGLGTPGVHPYLVGQSEGRGVLDIVRAAQQLDGAGVEADSPVAIFGHSQGGHAALMAAELAGTYAPELDVVGTVAGAPPGELSLIEASMAQDPAGFGLMMNAGFEAAYPDLPRGAFADADGQALIDDAADACGSDADRLAAQAAPGDFLDASQDPEWKAVFDANSPGQVVPSAPVFIFHGSADTTVPPLLSEKIAERYCDLGATVERTVYPGTDHVTVLFAAIGVARDWIVDRLAGDPAPSSC